MVKQSRGMLDIEESGAYLTADALGMPVIPERRMRGYRLVVVDGAVGGGWTSCVSILSTHRESPVGCSAHPHGGPSPRFKHLEA